MEHSKLPWIVENVDNMRSNRRPESLEINNDDWNIVGWTEAEVCGGVYEQDLINAEFIVKVCNEHDTLKAKAELLDELNRLLNSTEPGDEIRLSYLLATIKELSK